MKEYENPEYSSMIGKKDIYFSIENECRKFYCVDDSFKLKVIPELFWDYLGSYKSNILCKTSR